MDRWGAGKDVAIGVCVVLAIAMIPEAAPLWVEIGVGAAIGATGGAAISANDYNSDHPDPSTWDNGDLGKQVGKGAVIGAAGGAIAAPRIAGGLIRVLQQLPDETFEGGGGI